MISEETEKFLNDGNIENNNDQAVEVGLQSPAVISSKPKKPQFKSKTIDEMREELEIKKLQIELDKLEKPNTSIDYFQKMLELQQNHFNQLLTMQKQQSDLQVELEKLKLGGEKDDGMMGYISMLAPYIPQIIDRIGRGKNEKNINNESNNLSKSDNRRNQDTSTETITISKDEAQNTNISSEDEEMSEKDKIIESGDIQAYNELIRKGEVTLEEAYQDLCDYTPYGKFVTKEQFEKKFNEIKEGKA